MPSPAFVENPGLPPFAPSPVTLVGRHVTLRPLALADAPALLALVDADLWRWLPDAQPTTLSAMQAWVSRALAAQDAGQELCFAQCRTATGEVVGTTRYLDIQRAHRGLEIGATFLGAAARRTPLNTEAKFLLLQHAFDGLGAIRVALKTDIRNERSQRAIERLGAQPEGIHRAHRIRPDGTWRDTVWYAVIRPEWPAVRDRLQRLLAGAP